MRYVEIINESLSRIAFHYSGIRAANKILKSGQFELSSALGSIETQYAPKGYPYFLSATRTRHGGYHEIIGSQGVLFVLDGNWFNQHYPSKPIDYWLNRDPSQSHHRSHEAEDRIFSKKPTMPIDGVTAVHILVKPDADEKIKAWARQSMILAKKREIPVYLYSEVEAWKNFDSRKLADISMLKGQEHTGGYMSTHPGYLISWIELLQANSVDQLSKRARDLRYSLMYNDYYKKDTERGLANDLSNARKPDSGIDRSHAVKIIDFMQKHKLANITEFVDFLSNKWKNIPEKNTR